MEDLDIQLQYTSSEVVDENGPDLILKRRLKEINLKFVKVVNLELSSTSCNEKEYNQ